MALSNQEAKRQRRQLLKEIAAAELAGIPF